ncbi:MAG: TrkA family potassium uptake protein [Eubacteriaceae bacterium]|nr:TrkA family potassium uptake protein [Eubacteriaceae bacterium]
MRKSYAVFGLGEFGKSVALELSKMGADVLVCDMDESKVAAFSDKVTGAVMMDALDEPSYSRLGISNMDGVIVSMTGNMDASIFAILKAKEAGVPLVLAKAANATQELIFKKIGADRVVIPERDGGIRIARSALSGNYLDYIELYDKMKMIELNVEENWIGHSLQELKMREKRGINVIAVNRSGKVITDIRPDFKLLKGDKIIGISHGLHK